MDLLYGVYESLEFKELGIILNELYQGKKKISYDKFCKLIIKFGLKIMENYLKINDLFDEKFSFSIEEKLPIYGRYYSLINEIVISDVKIKNLYDGDIKELLVIFHELNHFKIKCDLIKENYSFDLLRVLKEKIVESNIDYYYSKNYSLFSEEVYADLLSVKNLFDFLSYFQIKLSKFDYEVLKKYLLKLKEDYSNNIRDFTHTLKIKDNYLPYEEVFDMFILSNSSYLKDYPILNIEYYYESGIVKKRTFEELTMLYVLESSSNRKKLIQDIILKNTCEFIKKLKVKK